MTGVRAISSCLLLLLALAGAAADAAAESFHERIEAKPINKGGEVVGLRLKLTLRPDGSQGTVQVALGKASNLGPSTYRAAATDPSKGFLQHQFPDMKVEGKAPKEVTLEVLYKDAPGLTPGQSVDVITAWKGSSYVHVWGMNRSGVTGTSITLPAPKKAAESAASGSAASRARMTRGLAAQRTKATAARKATARKAAAKKTVRRSATRARR